MLTNYINIPFVKNKDTLKGADCFGLVRLFYKEELGLEIFKHSADADKIKQVIFEYLNEAKTNWVNVETLEKFDVIAMAHDTNHPNIIQHFGIYIGNNKMLHTLKEIGSHIVDIRNYRYFIKNIHRHKGLING